MKDTLFYAPNILNYIRLFLLIATIFLPKIYFIIFYGISSFLDLFDGEFARHLGQTSVLGACLDMFTDRIGPCIITYRILQLIYTLKFKNLYENGRNSNRRVIETIQKNDEISSTDSVQEILAHQDRIRKSVSSNPIYDSSITSPYGSKMLNFMMQPSFLLFSLCIDILAHNFLFTANKIKNTNHKETHCFSILSIYYNKPILIFLCMSTEVFYGSLYTYLYLCLNCEYPEKNILKYSFLKFCKQIIYLTFPGCIIRGLFNVVQLFEGIVQLGRI